MRKDQDSNSIFIFSLLFPGLGFLAVISKAWNKSYHKIILLFAFWFGFFVYLNDTKNGDIVRYKVAFATTSSYSWSDYFYLVGHTFSEDKLIVYNETVVNSKPDFYALSVQFFVSRFTDNFRWFFGFISFFYTLFFLKFLYEARLLAGHKQHRIWRLVFGTLMVIVPFYVGVTGIRFWTALFLFMWFLLKFIRTKNLLYLFIAACSIFIHYTFMFPVAILFIYRFLNLSKTILKVLVIVSLAIFTITSTTGLLNYASEALTLFEDSSVKDAADSYTNEDELAVRSEAYQKTNWYVRGRENAILFLFIGIFLIEFFGVYKWRTDERIDSWYSLYVLFFCILLISMGLGSLARFKYVFYLLCLVRLLVIVGINPYNNKMKLLYRVMLPIMLLHFFVSCRAGFYYIDPLLFVGNPIVYLVTNSSESLSEFLVGH
jgi:hypothetical protein